MCLLISVSQLLDDDENDVGSVDTQNDLEDDDDDINIPPNARVLLTHQELIEKTDLMKYYTENSGRAYYRFKAAKLRLVIG